MRLRSQPLGNKNLIGARVEAARKSQGMKQKELLAQLQVRGVDLNASGLSKLEGQIRFVTDFELLALSDLFLEGSDYVGAVSADILRQMEEQVAAGEGDYFIPGGIWSEEECFQAIDPDQQFYLDENGDLVIVFGEYEVAPGSMGMPRFVIDQEAISDIWAR